LLYFILFCQPVKSAAKVRKYLTHQNFLLNLWFDDIRELSAGSLFTQKNYTFLHPVNEVTQHIEIEARIIPLLQKRDKAAIQLIYKYYGTILLGTITRIVRDEQIGEDVFQDAMVKIWKNGPQYDATKGRLFTWMIRICRNQAIDLLRSKGFKASQKIQSDETSVANSEMNAYTFNPDQIGVKEKLDKLPESYREVIEIVYYNGYTHQEAAKALNLPLGTVKSRVRIAIRELRTIFGIETT
jgi:RNA polymerase sigma-70 factor (ECF subfamily)